MAATVHTDEVAFLGGSLIPMEVIDAGGEYFATTAAMPDDEVEDGVGSRFTIFAF